MPSYEFECPGGGDTVEVVIPLDRIVPIHIPCPTCGCEMDYSHFGGYADEFKRRWEEYELS